MTSKSAEKSSEKSSREKQLEDLYRLREIYMRSSMWIRDVKLDGQDICLNRNRKYKNRNGNRAAGSGK